METILYVLIFITGTVFGSFFTLAVYRLPLGLDITHERSFCPKCNHKLSFLDMIPVLSYIFLGGKCRYCKNKIRIRYFLLEILSGIVFLLFSMSMNIKLETLTIDKIVMVVIGLLYISALFIIAGIDKEKRQIQLGVILFGFIIEVLYIIYLYIVGNTNMYRYVIYLCIIAILELINISYLKKKFQNSYVIDVLIIALLMIIYTGETVFALSGIAFLAILLIKYIIGYKKQNKKHIKSNKKILKDVPVAYYMIITNIIMLIITNYITYV